MAIDKQRIDRRSALTIGGAAAASVLVAKMSKAEGAVPGGVKLTVIYGTPKDPKAFDEYYLNTHMPLANAVKGIKRIELGKVLPPPDGQPPTYFRITEIYFDSVEQMRAVTSSPEWQKVREDVPKFATGSVIAFSSNIEA
jgi:uncharacterized protein (TIGR02118 family)